MASDPIASSIISSAPARRAAAVSPHATNDLPDDQQGATLYVGGEGNLVVVPFGGDTEVTLVGVPAGTFVPLRVRAVRNTSSTTNIVALW